MAHGKICYLEIPARTGEESAAFYRTIFGWTVRTRGDGELAFDGKGGVQGAHERHGRLRSIWYDDVALVWWIHTKIDIMMSI